MTNSAVRPNLVIVGPTHPHTGGIAQHTTRLALELEKRGQMVVVESWSQQYPRFLRPDTRRLVNSEPEIGLPRQVREKLAWWNPLSWWQAGVRARSASAIVINVPTPFHALVYRTLFAASGATPLRVAIVHNVTPHETRPGDGFLMRGLLRACHRVIVHSHAEAVGAESLGVGSSSIRTLSLPSPWFGPFSPEAPHQKSGQITALFFGTVRAYKGLDVLLKALVAIPELRLVIAGEVWSNRRELAKLMALDGVKSRVALREGYVEHDDFDELFGSADFLVLPYRSGTASVVKDLAFSHGLPVVATRAGAIAEGIVDGVNGALADPGSVASLTAALKRATDPDTLTQWKKAVAEQHIRNSSLWDDYCEAVVEP